MINSNLGAIFHLFRDTATYDKKSELMLTIRARASNSFCSQVVLVHLHPFCQNSLVCKKVEKSH